MKTLSRGSIIQPNIRFHSTSAGLVLLLLIAAGAAGQTQPCPEANGVKYVQWPDTTPNGVDVWNSSTFPPGVTDGPWLLADDFVCTNTGPITDIHLWGSWLNNQIVPNTITFWVGLFDDVPAGPGNPFSRPGQLLWEECFAPGSYSELPGPTGQETFLDPGPPTTVGTDQQIWYYCFYPTNPPTQYGSSSHPTNYWLAVYAQMPAAGGGYFGWKTTTNVQHDVSVHTFFNPQTCPNLALGTSLAGWTPTVTSGTAQRSLDLAFKLNTSTNPPVACVETNGAKYVQWPNLIGGLDVWDSSTRPTQVNDGPWWLADDFVCTNTGPITDIHLWGSWQNNSALSNSITFQLYVLDDVAAAPPINPYSHPGTNIVWHQTFPPGSYAELIATANASEYFLDPGIPLIVGGDNVVWYYCFYPSNLFQYGSTSRPTNYWLAVFAELPTGTPNVFGWKSTTNVQHDISVHGAWTGFGAPPLGVAWQPNFQSAGNQQPFDLAFKLTTPTNGCPVQITCPMDKRVECGTNWVFDPPIVGPDPCCSANPPGMSLVIVTNSSAPCNQSYTAIWTITNCLGTVLKVCTQTVTVTDTTPPVLYCTNLVLGCGETSYTNPPSAYDQCCGTNVTVQLENSQVTYSGCGKTISQLWLARDCCSNSVECLRTVNIVAGLGNILVVPNTNLTVEGDSGNSYPFNIGASTMRYQQVYAAPQFGTVPAGGAFITAISFRVDAGWGAFSATLPAVQINLSTTPKAPDALDTTFANNVGLNDTVVFNGALGLSSAAIGSPAAFDILIPLNTPFWYNPAAGNLLLDVRNTGGGTSSGFDATSIVGDSVSRVYGAVGSATGGTDTLGLVTDFTFGTGTLSLTCTNVTIACTSSVPTIPPVITDPCCTNVTLSFGGNALVGNGPCAQTYWQFWNAMDCCSNSVSCTTVIEMVDSNAPVFLGCVAAKTVQCTSAWSFDPPAAKYSCTGINAVVGVLSTVTNVLNGCSLTATRTWTATNECSGAVGSCTEVVTVMDTNAPVLSGCISAKTVPCGTNWSFDLPSAHYLCSGSNVLVGIFSTITNLATPCTNIITRVWSATNQCSGTSSSCSEVVTVLATNPPAITCPTNMVVYTCGTNAVFVTWPTNVASSACSSVTVTSSPPSGTAFLPNTTNTVTLTAHDACGNSNQCTFTVTVTRPVLGPISITYSPPNITIHWAYGILEQADTILGPWTDTLGASPPSYTVAASAAERFYRLRCAAP